MKQILLFALVAVLLLGCLAGCGDDKPQDESSTPVGGEDVGTTTTGGDSTTGGADDTTTDPNATETGDSSMTGVQDTTTGVQDSTTTGVQGNDTPTTSKKPGTTTSTTKTQTTTPTTKKENQQTTATDSMLAPYVTATPKVKYVSAYDPTSAGSNIKAITYDGATIGGKKTKVFAYVGFPAEASASNKVPAVVLVHGGGGHAFAEWVKIWNDRGYAAIAMDTTGFFPAQKGGNTGWESDPQTEWHYGLYGDFTEAGYVNAPNNDEMSSSAKPLDQQWMYHAIASTMVAHNILQGDSRVDGKKIGISGISWGGIITSLAIGYDTDYAFAIPIYGSAYLDEAHSYMGRYFSEANTKKLWSAADRLNRVKFPVMWLGYASDVPFSINSNSKSYMDTKKTGSVLSMKISMGHSHGLGWKPLESYFFADSVVGKRGAITKVVNEPAVKKNADGSYTVTVTIAADPKATEIKVQAAYLNEPLSYSSKNGGQPSMDQTWKGQKGTLDGNTITVTFPKDAVDFQIIISTKTAEGKYDISTQFVEGLK